MENPIDAPMDKRPADLTDKAFRISLYLKGGHGLLETIGGTFLLFVQPGQIDHWAHSLAQGEVTNDFIARHVLNAADHLTGSGLTFGAIYLLSHGLAKLILIVQVLRDRLWAYPALIGLVGLFIIYQVYKMAVDGFAISWFLLTVFDLIVIYLTQKEYRRHKARHEARHHA